MSESLLALVVGTVLAVGALAYVLAPLFFARDAERKPDPGEKIPVGEPALATDDDIEARVRAYRQARPECPRCGLRPEPDALYCSTCGEPLGDVAAE